MTLPDLVRSLRLQADIASSTDRGAVLAEAADRLEALAADGCDSTGSNRIGRGWNRYLCRAALTDGSC